MKPPFILTITLVSAVATLPGAVHAAPASSEGGAKPAQTEKLASAGSAVNSAPSESRAFPPAADSAYFLAGQYAQNGQYSDAISYFDQAIKLASVGGGHFRIADAFYSRGNANVYLGKSAEALEDYSKCLRLDCNYSLAYYMRGQLYQGHKEHQKAIADFKKATELDQKCALAYGGMGLAYHSLGENERTIEYASNSIAIDPQNAWFYDIRAQAYWDLGEFQKYVDDISREIVLLTDSSSQALAEQPHAGILAPAYFNRAQAYQKLGKNDLAQKDLDKARALGYKPVEKSVGST